METINCTDCYTPTPINETIALDDERTICCDCAADRYDLLITVD